MQVLQSLLLIVVFLTCHVRNAESLPRLHVRAPRQVTTSPAGSGSSDSRFGGGQAPAAPPAPGAAITTSSSPQVVQHTTAQQQQQQQQVQTTSSNQVQQQPQVYNNPATSSPASTTTSSSSTGGVHAQNLAAANTGTTTSTPTTTTSSGEIDCFNLPPFPTFCSYSDCFNAKEQCLGYYRYCLQQYPNQNTVWYAFEFLPCLTPIGIIIATMFAKKGRMTTVIK